MDLFEGRYYRINKLILSFIGLWPYQRARIRMLTTYLTMLGIISFCVPQVIYIVKFLDDLDNLLGSLPTSMGGLMMTSKVLTLMHKTTVMKDLLDQIHEDWNSLTSIMEEEILKKYAETGRKFTVSYGFIVLPPVIIYVLLPLNAPILDIVLPLNESRKRVLPNPGEYFIDQDKYYFLLIFSQYYAYAIGMLISFGSDTIYIVFIHHGCGMFAILCNRLQNLSTLKDGITDGTDIRIRMEKEVYRHVIQCIKLHNRAKRFAELIASVFTTFLLFDIGLGIILHSTSCVMMSDVIHYAGLVIAQSVRMFLNNWPGQNLMDHSTDVSIAAYNGQWYNMSIRARRLLLLLMMKSQSPCTLTIAGLYTVNLDSFGTIMKTSVSYCTIMASLHDAPDQ